MIDNFGEHMKASGGDAADVALEFGLVDDLVTRAEFRERMIEIAGSNDEGDSYPITTLGDYLQQMRIIEGSTAGDVNVAVVVAAGEILYGSQPPGTIGGDSTAQLLRKARNDESVAAVVLRVDSPGGSALASEIIRNEIEELQKAGKPVVASMSSVAASGGYWISMAADQIYATPYTITGSIGIFGMFPTFQRSLETIGIHTDGIGTTTLAGQLRSDREMSEQARELFQLGIDRGYDDFITRVAEHRGLEKSAVDAVAQGRIWTGDDALKHGLIDGLGEIEEAIAAAAELAELEDDHGVISIKPQLSPGEQLALELLGTVRSTLPLERRTESPTKRLTRTLDDLLAPLTRFNDPRGVYAHCFCQIE